MRVWGMRLRVRCSGFSGFRVCGAGFSRSRVSGTGFGFSGLEIRGFTVRGFGCGFCGSVFSRFGVLRFRVFEVLGFWYGVSSFGNWGVAVRGFAVRGLGYEVSQFGVSVPGFRGPGVSRFGVSGMVFCRVWVFDVRAFKVWVSGSQIGVFEDRDIGYGISRFGVWRFRVSIPVFGYGVLGSRFCGSGFSRIGVSGTGF